jgi:hypothetical protein
MLTAPAQPHKAFLRRQCGLLFGSCRVSFDDGGFEQGVQPAERDHP